jgi:hypothetical protein
MPSRNLEHAIAKTAKNTKNYMDGRMSVDGLRGSIEMLPCIREMASRSVIKSTAKSQRNNNYFTVKTSEIGASSRSSSRIGGMSLSKTLLN